MSVSLPTESLCLISYQTGSKTRPTPLFSKRHFCAVSFRGSDASIQVPDSKAWYPITVVGRLTREGSNRQSLFNPNLPNPLGGPARCISGNSQLLRAGDNKSPAFFHPAATFDSLEESRHNRRAAKYDEHVK